MDSINTLTAKCTLPDCCRTTLWDSVEQIASSILERYRACGCMPWTDIDIAYYRSMGLAPDIVRFMRTNTLLGLASDYVLQALLDAHCTHGRVIVDTLVPEALPQHEAFAFKDLGEFGDFVYVLLHGLCRHADCAPWPEAAFEPAFKEWREHEQWLGDTAILTTTLSCLT